MIDAIELDALRALARAGSRAVVEPATLGSLITVVDAATAVERAQRALITEMQLQSAADRRALDDAFVASVERLLMATRAVHAANDAEPEAWPERAR